MKKVTARTSILAISLLCLVVLSPWGAAQTETKPDILATRTISTSCALPESQFLVTINVEVNRDMQGLGIEEILPYGWSINPIENAGAAFKRSDSQWTFNSKIKAGSRIEICYEVTVPPTDKLYADTLPECFEFSGIVQSKAPAIKIEVTGDSEVEIVSSLPLKSAITHLVPASDKQPLDTVDLRLRQKITSRQFERAIELWKTSQAIPLTGGEVIDLALMEKLVSYYETCTPVNQDLPSAEEPRFRATRTISTFLPCDILLLPYGCLNPGIEARRFMVTLEITAENDVYGFGVKEWLPQGWHIDPLDNDGFVYRSSHQEWIFPKRLAAGETRKIVYQAEAAPELPEGVNVEAGCRGYDARIVGIVSSVLSCGEDNITGEDTVHMWQCLPVTLAISRLDVSSDSLDVKLSNNISFPQVQRAVAFWQNSQPVPYTCGYTVGYETLKTIVAYWLTGTEVTQVIPGSKPITTQDVAIPGSYDWFCRMQEKQPDTDRKQVSSVPLVVDAQAEQPLTCLIDSTKLTATVSGGLPPYSYLWKDSQGSKVGFDKEITVSKPDTYTVTVSSADACRGSDSVVVEQNIARPNVDAGPDQLLTCMVTSVTLDGSASGGTQPYTYQWVDWQGNIIGTTQDIEVSKPGRYTLKVTGANGCQASDCVTVNQDISAPDVSIAPAEKLTCMVTSVTLDGKATGGTPPYTYSWTNSDGETIGKTEDTCVDTPDTYTLTVIGNNGCQASASIKVEQDITPPTLEVTESASTLTCSRKEITLKAQVADGCGVYEYSWVNSSGEKLSHTDELTVDKPDQYTITVTGANGCQTSQTIPVDQDISTPDVSIATPETLTCIVTSVTLDGSASGGTAPYTYSWTNSDGQIIATTEDICVDTADTYTLTVTGDNGCCSSASVTVLQDVDPPVVDAGYDKTITCRNPTAKLDATISGGSSPYTYQWTDPSGAIVGCTEDIIVDQPGIYTLTVIGINACQASDTVKVEKDTTSPTIEVTGSASTLTCSRKEITLKAQVADGCGVYEYSWVNSSGEKLSHTDELTVDKPDQYTITVTGENGCQTRRTVVVDQDISTPDVSIATPETLTCIVTSVTLDGSASGGTAPYTYSWTNSDSQIIATTEDICVDAADTYTLTVTGDNGCCSSASVTVSEDVEAAVVDAGSDQLLTCAVTSVTLDGSASGGTQPYTYQWVDWQGNIIGTTQDIEVSKPGRYTLKVTGANGCQASDCVTVNQDISAPDVSIAPAEKLTCMVTSVTLDGSASGGTQPYKYEWADAGGNIIGITQDIQVSQAGSYTLTVTAGNGCQASASVTVSEDVEAPVVNAGPDRELTCLVSQLTLSADASGGKYPYIFLWRDEYGNILSMEQEWVVNSAGIYRITVVGANGCCGSDEIVVTENTAPPQVSAGPDKVITCSNPEVFIDADISGGQSPYQIEWVNDCGDIVATTEDITVTLPGVYTILVTGNNGCSAFDSVAVSDGIVAPQVDAGPDQLLTCEQEQVMLDATVWGGTSPYTYSWTNACGVVVGTTENLTVSLPSVYTLTVTTADGCVGSDSVRVDKEE